MIYLRFTACCSKDQQILGYFIQVRTRIVIDTIPNCFINGSILCEVCWVHFTRERVHREAPRGWHDAGLISTLRVYRNQIPKSPIAVLVFESKVSLKIYHMSITHQKFRSFQPPWPPQYYHPLLRLLVRKARWRRNNLNRTMLTWKSCYRKTLVSYPFHDTYDTILRNLFILDSC